MQHKQKEQRNSYSLKNKNVWKKHRQKDSKTESKTDSVSERERKRVTKRDRESKKPNRECVC